VAPTSQPRADPAHLRLARLERLQWLTEALSAAVTREDVARIIFDRGLGLVDASAVSVFWERRPGELELVHGLGVSEEFAAGYRRVFADEPFPAAEAYRDLRPVWLASRAEIGARFPALGALVEREGVQALAAVPLSSGGSRGAVGFQFETPRAFDAEEQAFVLAVVRQCAQAVERARLFDAQKRLAERLQQLQLTAATLSAVATPRDVAAAAFRALGAIGATAAEIHATQGPERLTLVARYGRAADDAEGAVAIDAPEPAPEVVRTGRALWLESPEEIAGRYPRLEERREHRHEGAWAAVPLLASGKAVGALTVAFPTPRRLEADERTFVRLVAQPCAAALERARLFEEAARSRSEAEWNADVLGAMCGAAPVGLALLDRARRFIRVNEVFARLGGVAPESHAGREAAEVLPSVVADQIEHAVKAVLESGQAVERVLVGESHASPGMTLRFAASAFPVRVERALVGVGLLLRETR
jgi:GAF domain-containing protein